MSVLNQAHEILESDFFLPDQFLILSLSRADEGMWLLNEPPTAQLKQKYNFLLTPEWLEHAQKSAVRFNSGRIRKFVSLKD